MFHKFITAAVLAASVLALGAGPASADLVPGLKTPRAELVISGVSSTAIVVENVGQAHAGAFTVGVSAGWLGDTCDSKLDPILIRVRYGLRAGKAIKLALPTVSSTVRIAEADVFGEVPELNEYNNKGTVPAGVVVC